MAMSQYKQGSLPSASGVLSASGRRAFLETAPDLFQLRPIFDKRFNAIVVELAPRKLAQFLESVVHIPCLLIRAPAGKCIENIRYSNDPGFDGYIIAAQAMGITFSVQGFVVVFRNVAKNVEILEGSQSENRAACYL